MFEEFGINAGLVEELHARFLHSPGSVPETWQRFFGGDGAVAPHTNGNGHRGVVPPAIGSTRDVVEAAATPAMIEAAALQGRVYQLVNAYRVRGHLYAAINPLEDPAKERRELALETFGLSPSDLDQVFPTVGIHGLGERATLRDIIAHLEATYCGSIGVEFTHIEDPDARGWLLREMESSQNRTTLSVAETLDALTKLTDAEIFEQFIHKNYVGAKRFSLEGGESMIVFIDRIVEHAGAHGVAEVVLGMAHRGRLNVLANIMGKNVREIFAAFDDKKPEQFIGSGDVKYHLGYSSDRKTTGGQNVHLSLCFNPSHLEFVNPVVEGRARAKQDRKNKGRGNVMPLLVHGDAAFMGQGVVPETLNLTNLEGFATGGTVHLVINNQIGFTTNFWDSRSTRYCTDIARMLKVPVFHVNGEDPEAVIQVTRLAVAYRQRYAQDVVIDMYCYRKYGHNEGDEPRFTQPKMYALIDKKPTVREMYVKRLVAMGKVSKEQCDAIVAERKALLDQALEETRKGDFYKKPSAMEGLWKTYAGGPNASVPEPETGVDEALLHELANRLAKLPEGFKANPKAAKLLEQRREKVLKNETFDWGTGEHLAFASLLVQGAPIRLTGQDVRRGTFTHRHAVVYDADSNAPYMPLRNLAEQQARIDIFDSALSEAGVLGYEYGYSLDYPDGLTIWEAQFGDFANGAQVIIDQFIVSAEDKWSRLSGLVMLLPHGYEGQGPEHSSGRLERFLQLAAEDNVQICQPTTPAQIFHLLRRQVLRPIRKPLIVMTPKSLLRHPEAVSTTADLAKGKFEHVLVDCPGDRKKVERVLLCTGKVYYDLKARRAALGKENEVAIVRFEQLYPLTGSMKDTLASFGKKAKFVWVQDEPKNMGAWGFVAVRWSELAGEGVALPRCASRAESASPATGSHGAHQIEQKMLLDEAFG